MKQQSFIMVIAAVFFMVLVSNSSFAEQEASKTISPNGLALENDTLTSTANDLDENTKEITAQNSAASNPIVSVHNDHLTSTANGEFIVNTSGKKDNDIPEFSNHKA